MIAQCVDERSPTGFSYPMQMFPSSPDQETEVVRKREILRAIMAGKWKWTAHPSERGYQDFLTIYRLLGDLSRMGTSK